MTKKIGIRCVEKIRYSRIGTDQVISTHTRIIALSYAASIAAHATGTIERECLTALVGGRTITEVFENKDMRVTISWYREEDE